MMAHAGGSGSDDFTRLTNFTEAEARVLWENGILVPPAWHLPHEWHVSAAGYVVPPIPEGAELEDLISQRWQMLPLHERDLPRMRPAVAFGCRGCNRSGRRSLANSPGLTLAATMSSADVPGGRTATSMTCFGSTATRHPCRAAPLQALVRRRPRRGRGAHRRTGAPRRAPRRTHYRRDAMPGSSSGMPRGLLRRCPAARRRRSQRKNGSKSRRSCSRRRGRGGSSTGSYRRRSPATPTIWQTRWARRWRWRTR
jgi:hypothetical protein